MRRLLPVIFFISLPFFLQAQQTTPVWKTYYDSAQLFWAKDWKKTIPLLVKAEKSALYDLGVYDDNYLTILNDLGLAYARNKDFSNAEKLLTKSLSIKQEMNRSEPTDASQTLLNLATVHAEQDHVQQAEQLYKQILSTQSPEPENNVKIQAIKNLIALYESINRIDEALSLISTPYVTQLSGGNDQSFESFELQIIRIHLERKSHLYDQARTTLTNLKRFIGNSTDQKTRSLSRQCLLEEGLLDLETGHFNKAEKTFLEVFRQLKVENPGDKVMLTEVLNNLASVYEKIGVPDKALIYYQDAMVLCNEVYGSNSLNSLTLQSNIAGIQLRQGALISALKSYGSIEKKLSEASASSIFYITVLNNLATAYRANKQIKEAQLILAKAQALMEKTGQTNDDLYAGIMNNMAVLLTSTGNSKEAIRYYEKAYSLRRLIYGDNSVLLMDLASNMAVVYWELKQPEQALPLFEKSNALAIRQIKYIFPNLSEDEQVLFYKKLKEDFERFNTIALTTSGNGQLLTQVFNNQITIKSLLFFTQRHRRDLITEKRDTVLTRQYELLKSKREQLGYLYQLSLKDLSHADVSASSLEKEIDDLEKAISLKTSETLAEKMMEQGANWKQIQARIKADEALVEIIRFRKYDLKKFTDDNGTRVSFGFTDSVFYAALVTTKETTSNPELILMKEGTNMETRFVNYYRNALVYKVTDLNSFPYYWKPFESAIRDKVSIFVSGDGVYHRLNLNTLFDTGTGKYLIERYHIQYLLNPAQILESKTTTFSSKKATLMGDPVFDYTEGDDKTRAGENFTTLPGTLTEINKINNILKQKGWDTQVYLKKFATERNLKNIHSPAILHVATHGFFSADKVKLSAEAKKDFLFYSGLVLSGANKNLAEETQEIYDDGILTAYEVMNLDLTQTHLVVLSACETGLGKIENNEGVYGLQRSFLQAGARNILISLWKVDDHITQELMVKFYQHLFDGKTEREALKMAQLEQLKKTPNPLAWGGFIVVGLD